MAIAKHGDIGQQEGAIFAEAFRLETVFVYEVKSETASEQRFVDALRCLVHVCARAHCGGTGVEKLRALPDHDSDIGDGAAGCEVGIVPGGPAEVIDADLLPAAVFAKTVLRADEVIVGNHAAGEGFVQPHPRLGGVLRGVAPASQRRWSRRR